MAFGFLNLFACIYKLIDFILNVDAARMASVSNFTLLVNESDKRDTSKIPNSRFVVTELVVLDFVPSFLVDVITNRFPAIID